MTTPQTNPTPTAAAMRAAEAVSNLFAETLNRGDPVPWDDIASCIDAATGLPELTSAAHELAAAATSAVELLIGEGFSSHSRTVQSLSRALRSYAKALARLEAPQPQPVPAPPTAVDPLPRLAQQIWRALPYDHTPGVLMASESDVEAALRRAIPLAQVRITDAQPVAQASGAEEKGDDHAHA